MIQTSKQLTIAGECYQLLTNYQHNDLLRHQFNKLTRQTYDFTFEKWYKSGYWENNCLLYSFIKDGKIVSHITVTVIDFIILGEQKKLVQLGTIMTDEHYRGQGLARTLLKEVIHEWENKCDLIYLFANDDVLDFYPKFGFTIAHEYEAVKRVAKSSTDYTIRKLHMKHNNDRELLYHTAKNNKPLFKLSMNGNAGLIMFYSHYFDPFSVGENIYFIEELETIVIAEYDRDVLMVYDILTTKNINIDHIIDAMLTKRTREVILGSIPLDSRNYEISPFKEEDSTLFVLGKESELFKQHRLCFPILSHT